MKIRTYKIINILIIFLLSFLTHNLYNWFPNPIFACIFPVNESIAEHMKMLFTTFIISGIIESISTRKIILYNRTLNILISSIVCIFSFLLLWLPIYYFLGENMIITLSIMLISIAFSQLISYKLYILKYEKDYTVSSIIMILLIMISTGIFTFIQPHIKYFEDPKTHNYGIIKG